MIRDRGRLAKTLSAVAVVVSLVFVGLEVRESARQTELNTQSLQVSAYQDLISQITEINARSMDKPEISLLIAATSSFEELSEIEREQVFSAFMLVARHGDMAFYQYELGMLTAERLESALGVLNNAVCRSVFRQFWAFSSHNFVVSYREFVDAKISTQDCPEEWGIE